MQSVKNSWSMFTLVAFDVCRNVIKCSGNAMQMKFSWLFLFVVIGIETILRMSPIIHSLFSLLRINVCTSHSVPSIASYNAVHVYEVKCKFENQLVQCCANIVLQWSLKFTGSSLLNEMGNIPHDNYFHFLKKIVSIESW